MAASIRTALKLSRYALHDDRHGHEDERRQHGQDQEIQQADVLLDQHAIDDHLREDRQEHGQPAGHHRQADGPPDHRLDGRTNGQSQAALGASTGARANASV